MEKRYDIQGLRAWAVIAVVLFHFFPSLLPFGYLGVDVFFVLSGFLISLVLQNRAVFVVATYTNFYFKRIRRIFPLLLMIILICSLYAVLCYSDVLFMYSEKSALLASLFITNLKNNNEGEDYFRDLEHADDIYTHTWSLSVEIQFYLLAPLLLHVMKPSCSDPFHTMGYLLGLAGISFVYSRVSPTAAFYSTIARLWQFTSGAIAFQLLKEPTLPLEKESPPELPRYLSTVADKLNIIVPSILAVTLIVWCAIFDSWESSFRCAITFSAATLLVLKLTTPFLTHRSLQIIGDSSYALYLIHWPVVCILRFYGCDQWIFRFISMLLCVLASALVYDTYEKWYLTLNEKWTFVLIGGLYLASLSVYIVYYITHPEVSVLDDMYRPRSYSEARITNLYMDSHWEQFIKVQNCSLRDPSVDRNPWGFCNLPSGNGNLSFLIIGNSYAANHGRMIVDNLRDHYGRIAIHTVSECEPLIETKNDYCKEAVKMQEGFLRDIHSFKPDVLFLSARYIEPNVPIDNEKVEEDTLYKSMMEKLKRYDANVEKIFILQAFPRPANLQKVETARLNAGKPIEAYMEEAIEADSIPMRRRVEEIAKHCDKCVVYDLMQLHMVNGTFTVSNSKTHLHYFEALRHHTPIGLKLVEPVYQKLSENFDVLLKSKTPDNLVTCDD